MRSAWAICHEMRKRDLHVRICPWLEHEELWMDGKFYAWCSSRSMSIERLFQRALDLTDAELAEFRKHMQWRAETQFKGLMGDSQREKQEPALPDIPPLVVQ